MSGYVFNVLLDGFKRVWQSWNLRGCIALSLGMQASLLLLSPWRKRTRRKPIHASVWMAYLLCDWIAAVAIGLITKNKGEDARDHKPPKAGSHEAEFMAFWASFLLLHLGGPDTITSYAIEDNQFWFRHLTGLVVQLVSTSYIFYQTFPKHNKLWIPTALVFVAGTIKYAERTRALYLSSLVRFGRSVLSDPDPGPEYEAAVNKATDDLQNRMEIKYPEIKYPEVSPNEKIDWDSRIKLLKVAHRLFEKFKGLIVGYLLSSKDREWSRRFFLSINARQAFKIIAYELNFIYDLLHTKVVVVRCRVGYIFRFIGISSLLGAFLAFRSIEKKHLFEKEFDIKLSYALLFGALAFEAVTLLMLIFSDWTTVALTHEWSKRIAFFNLRRERWSRSISQYDMISYCLKGPAKWLSEFAKIVHLEGILDKICILLYSRTWVVSEELEKFIFDQLRTKSLTANDLKAAMEACSQRGVWALTQTSSSFKLKWSIEAYEYAESLMLWHLATELLYQKEQPDKKPPESCWPRLKKKMTPESCWPWLKKKLTPEYRFPCLKKKEKTPESGNENQPNHKEICKQLSDYMFHLVVMQPALMAPVLGNWQIAFQDTRAEANRFFREKKIKRSGQPEGCRKVLEVRTSNFRQAVVKGNSKSKSVLFDACILAKQLEKLDQLGVDRWRVMSRVWVELMSYAAIKCLPNVHAQQPSRGGELLTFVWLLMNHLGLGTQFYEHESQTDIKIDDSPEHDNVGQRNQGNNNAAAAPTSRCTEFSKFNCCH
ncbi:uncharacterized protein LOC132169932 [Corylus avellana]|uniref:uncharacterized protein LOC132169932 n=1 Tax=Corylus avellana TaxID=13451 RepID=UPI00286A7201|nr:uncharacterized protein LOC132169932 [Corylus avellana]